MRSEQITAADDRSLLEALVSADVGPVNRVDEGTTPYDHPRLATAFAQVCDTAAVTGATLDASAAGMGDDVRTAWTAAAGEAVERYSACHLPVSLLRLSPASELAGAVAEPYWLDHAGPRPPLHWLPGVRLSPDGPAEPAWLPAAGVLLAPIDPTAPLVDGTSTGLACHRDPWRALRSALLEVIERDAVMTSWLLGLPGRPVESALRWTAVNGTAIRFDLAVESYRLLLLDSPLGVPVVLAVAFGAEGRPAAAVGAAAHLDLARACRKALIEAHQTLRWAEHLIAQGRAAPSDPAEIVELADHVLHYVDPARRAAFDPLFARPAPVVTVDLDRVGSDSDPAADVVAMLRRARRRGIDCFCCDVTAPDVRAAGLWVIRAVVPRLFPLVVGTRSRPDHPRIPRGVPVRPEPHPFP